MSQFNKVVNFQISFVITFFFCCSMIIFNIVNHKKRFSLKPIPTNITFRGQEKGTPSITKLYSDKHLLMYKYNSFLPIVTRYTLAFRLTTTWQIKTS